MARRQYDKRDRAAAALELKHREYKRLCLECKGDPAKYVRDIRGEWPTPDQERALGMAVENRRTAWMAAHAVGKTRCAAWLAGYWYDCHEKSIAYITAPTWDQALGLTFKEITALRRSGCKAWRGEMPGQILKTGLIRDQNEMLEGSHYIKAINAESGEGFQGEHSAPILIIFEEATGVPEYIWEAAEGLMTHPDCRILAIGNPTDEATRFGMACKDGSGYARMSVSVFDHPNIQLEMEAKKPQVPEAVRLIWLKEQLEINTELTDGDDIEGFKFWSIPTISKSLAGVPLSKNPEATEWHYRPNAIFEGRALGRFPGQVLNQVIPMRWLERLERKEPPVDELPEIGVDCARSGDDRTVIVVRQGPCALRADVLRHMNQEYVTRHVREVIHWAASGDGRGFDKHSILTRFDITGGLGTGPVDALESEGYNIEGVNSSQSSDDPDQYPNMRSQLWFTMRDRVRRGDLDISRLLWEIRNKLMIELAIPKWEPDNKGRKIVESKKEIKKRLKESPDLADALNLAYSEPPESTEVRPINLERFRERIV